MLTFSKWLLEVQFKKGAAIGSYTSGILDFTFYKNPSSAEIKSMDREARGIVSEKGDLYLLDHAITANNGIYVHDDIIEMLSATVKMGSFRYKQFHLTPFSHMLIVPVQRQDRDILISESMRDDVLDDEDEITYAEKLFKKAKKKNSYFNFKAVGLDIWR